ncbi:MICOS complex subunit MIC13 homolog QIL1 [Drosophila nasuta]|uniref:MICOS complex subunit MIC13 n=1 Tax=Drosophila albomicans TaxID=7291 RepID=A0A6P8XIJ0_DROAB|nr:MICOS complex subunit MIC13 homolog QIL1 [Drosophila albomicans]XP_060658004.1 MICOS complex subunit MIC13 homolog QIL1 [Drosophila nasuta]
MVFGLLVRGGLVAGTVYYTRKAGVWGNPEETDKLLNDVKGQLCPYVQKAKKQLPFEVPKLPQAGEVRFLVKHYYNEGVKSSFRFIHMLPCYAGRGLKKVKDTFEDFAKSPAITGGSEKAAAAATK